MFLPDKKIKDNPIILIVEDDKNNIQVLGNILSKANYEVAVAFDGKSALNMLEQYLPDLILMDVLMPEMDGFELCHRIKAIDRYKQLPILFLTAKAEDEDIIAGFDHGGVDYITKPFHAGELLARVRTHLELKMAREELYEQTIHDELTGLFNRRHIRMELEHELYRAVRYDLDYAVALMDLDDFKKINDNYGHVTGDLALKRFAEICEHNIRRTDSMGRIGGEEFCLILPETPLKEARLVVDRIRNAIEIETEDKALGIPHFTVSIGLTGKHCQKEMRENINDILSSADKALYDAKENGKNTVVVNPPLSD